MQEITQEYLKELLSYDKDTGEFRWKPRGFCLFKTEHAAKIWNTRFPGTAAGNVDVKGYRKIVIHQRSYKAHRLAWLYVYGEWPGADLQIDHINGIRSDNRIANLRAVPPVENSRNLRPGRVGRSGLFGVHWDAKWNRWRAKIHEKGATVELGSFKTREEAIAARKAAEVRLGYHENHGKTVEQIQEQAA
ncbi:HNH endonuclease signature motif containing protein [Cupriavidus phytorum]|uniref:HNH endonuclease signature motif containing protein n=1 Tax=Cupriavidus phytorum TaxID=3024399 RepID=UPI000DAD4022|nr:MULTISPECIES: HNH endonuclease signature motif containing protein [Cupriavidus]